MQNPEMKTTKPSLVMPEGIGEEIRIIRRAANLTQTQLAEALGVVQQSVSAWERGWTLPSVETLWAFCKETGVSADTVLGLTTDERMGGLLAAGSLVHKIVDLIQNEGVRVSVAAPDVEAAEAALGASAGPFGGPGAGRVYDPKNEEDEEDEEDEGPYYCTATECLHFQNGKCKTGGVGCYL